MKMFPITNRADWLALRKSDVTASEVPALFGLSKFTSALQVYADKTGAGKGYGDNASMRAGRIMEAAIAAAVREEKPEWRVEKAEHYYRDEQHRIGATPDYFRVLKDAMEIEPIECKFVQPHIFAKDWQQGPPLMYILQTLVQIYLTEAKRGWIAVMIDNRAKDVNIYEVPRDDKAWERIKGGVARFWGDVAKGTIPGPDYLRDGNALKEIYPPDPKAAPLDLTGNEEVTDLLMSREHIVMQMKAMESEKEQVDARLIDYMRTAPAAIADGYSITYKNQTRKAYTIPETTFPVLRVTKTKEEKVL
jgi:putative phage-type endonuclease